MQEIQALGAALNMSFDMLWEVLWPLALGFTLSGTVQAVISQRSMATLLGDDSPRSLSIAAAFGIASSSCSYAATAIARSIFRKGASFAAAMVFEIASTNLVIELGIILIVLMGWPFAVSEFAGGLVMILLIALIFRFTLTPALVRKAREHAERGLKGRMEGHAAMDMSVGDGSLLKRIFSGEGFTAISHYFVMDVVSVWIDIALGFLIAGALAAWVPQSFWQSFFLNAHPSLARIEGPLIGPLVAVLSFVCSVGNVPLAAVLWKGGISFGGAVSFIFADLIVLPLLDIYRRYYGARVALYILATFYLAMAAAGYFVEILFGALHIIPSNRNVGIIAQGPVWNYTAVLNLVLLVVVVILVVRFLPTGGPAMLRMMEAPDDEMTHAHTPLQ